MQFYVVCMDKPDHGAVRSATREKHLAYLRSHDENVSGAGPILGDDGKTAIGSLLLLDADGAEAAQALVAQDPYALAGLFASVEVRPWRWVLKAPFPKGD